MSGEERHRGKIGADLGAVRSGGLVHNLARPLPSLVFLLPVFAFVDAPLRTLGTTDLTWDVIALRSHDLELVRALTTSVVREW